MSEINGCLGIVENRVTSRKIGVWVLHPSMVLSVTQWGTSQHQLPILFTFKDQRTKEHPFPPPTHLLCEHWGYFGRDKCFVYGVGLDVLSNVKVGRL